MHAHNYSKLKTNAKERSWDGCTSFNSANTLLIKGLKNGLLCIFISPYNAYVE